MIGAIGGRRRSGATITVVEAFDSDLGGTMTFAATPANGNLIVLVAVVAVVGTINTPSGFNVGPSVNQGAATPIAMFWKVASGESGAAYTITATSGTPTVYGAILSGQHASPVGNSGSNVDDTAGTTLQIAASNISVSDGSYVVALRSCGGTTTLQSFSNSFNLSPGVAGSGRVIGGSRLYTSGGAGQNTTASWSTSRGTRRGLLVELKAA